MTEDNMPQRKKVIPEDAFHFFFLDVKKKAHVAASIWGAYEPG
jgi:hypothetical protein